MKEKGGTHQNPRVNLKGEEDVTDWIALAYWNGATHGIHGRIRGRGRNFDLERIVAMLSVLRVR